MNASEFIIEKAPPPKGGRGVKSELRAKIEDLKPGEVLRWRGDNVNAKQLENVLCLIRKKRPSKTYQARKVNGGHDIYCVEDMAHE